MRMLSQGDRQKVLYDWNDTRSDFAIDRTIIDLFQEQVRNNADAIALSFEEEEISYAELDRRTNQLARFLHKKGVVKDRLVGVCIDRSLERIISLLGVIKSGGAYLPIDPDYPLDRINFMINDSDISVLLSKTPTRDKIGETKPDVICMDTDWVEVAKESDEPVHTEFDLSQLAYCIYTSGSTGNPKGVLIEHYGLFNLIVDQIERFAVSPQSRVLQFASFSFDASVLEVFTALCSGAELCSANSKTLLPGPSLLALIKRKEITHVIFPPSALAELPYEDLPGFHTLIVGGEVCPPQVVELWSKNRRFFNAYGPTEITVCATIKEWNNGKTTPPIGKPISNTSVYLLDENRKPVAIGDTGELYIGGVGVARGYLNRPDLTQEKFFKDPFSSEPNARMYKSGDLGKYLPDGDIEFLGRIDNQVKIRGFRIELGEVENTIALHQSIRQCVVLAPHDESGSRFMVAYIVPTSVAEQANGVSNASKNGNHGSAKDAQLIPELRKHLKQVLPAHMAPSFYVVLDSLPLTPNGKIDKNALPEPFASREDLGTEFVDATTATEKVVQKIWQEILNNQSIGVNDNFFMLGGHSLKIMRVVSRISEELEVTVNPNDFFSHPTIKSLSMLIDQGVKTSYAPIAKTGKKQYFDYSPYQKLFITADQFGRANTYNGKSAYLFEGKFYFAELQRAFDKLIERHESIRTRFPMVGDFNMQEVVEEWDFNVDFVDLSADADPYVAADEHIAALGNTQFRIETDFLMKAKVIKIAEEKHILAIVIHHIICDGWSVSVLMRDLLALIADEISGKNRLAPLNVQYRDFCAWQREVILNDDQIEAHRNYWKEQLKGGVTKLEVQGSEVFRSPFKTNEGGNHFVYLKPEVNEGLKELSRQNSSTQFMTLIALFKVLLAKYSGEKDINVGTPVAGRNHRDLEDQLGLFMNVINLRDQVEMDTSFSDLLKQVRGTILQAYDHQVYPFINLIEDLDDEIDISRNFLFDVLITFHNNDPVMDLDPEILQDLGTAKLTPYPFKSLVNRVDISFDIKELNESLEFNIEYNSDLFTKDKIHAIAADLEKVASRAIENPNLTLNQLFE